MRTIVALALLGLASCMRPDEPTTPPKCPPCETIECSMEEFDGKRECVK